MQPIIAELTVETVEASIQWYRDLGFDVELEGIRDDDGLQWVSMAREGRSVWLLREDISRHSAEHPPRVTFYLQVDNVDAVYGHLVRQGIQADSEPKNQWYGLREFTVRDPDGYCWSVNHSIPPEDCPPRPA